MKYTINFRIIRAINEEYRVLGYVALNRSSPATWPQVERQGNLSYVRMSTRTTSHNREIQFRPVYKVAVNTSSQIRRSVATRVRIARSSIARFDVKLAAISQIVRRRVSAKVRKRDDDGIGGKRARSKYRACVRTCSETGDVLSIFS